MNAYQQELDALNIGPFRFDGWADRDRLTARYWWGIPDDSAIQAIAALSPMVAAGCGAGYWAMLLRQAGADIVAFGSQDPGGRREIWFDQIRRTDIKTPEGRRKMGGEWSECTFFICWPPYNDPFAANCLRLWRGRTHIYVGEGRGSGSADNSYFDMLRDQFELMREFAIEQWKGANDRLAIYQRRANTDL